MTTKEILNHFNIKYKWYIHKPIKTYDDAIEVDQEFGIVGEESKNLFLKDNENNYYVFVTIAKNRFDKNLIKEKTDLKLKIASSEELEKMTNYVAGSAATFPYDEKISYIIDKIVFRIESLICSGGVPTESYTMNGSDLKVIFDNCKNKKIYI